MKMFVCFQRCIDEGFLYNIHFLSFYPFFSVLLATFQQQFSDHMAWVFVDILPVCLRSRDTQRDILS